MPIGKLTRVKDFLPLRKGRAKAYKNLKRLTSQTPAAVCKNATESLNYLKRYLGRPGRGRRANHPIARRRRFSRFLPLPHSVQFPHAPVFEIPQIFLLFLRRQFSDVSPESQFKGSKGEGMSELRKQVDTCINELRHAVIVAGLNYDVWWVYKEKVSREKFVDVMNDYLEFFSISIHAHFVALLAALYYIYEKRTDTINVPKLFELLSVEGVLSETDIAESKQLYEAAKPLWVKVSILRNEQFMHRASKLDEEDGAFRKANITPDDFKRLIDITRELLNEVTDRRDSDVHAFNLSAEQDIVRLLDDLNALRVKNSVPL